MNLLKDPWLLFNVQQPDGSIAEQTLPITAIAKTEVITHVVFRQFGQGKGKAKSHANDKGTTPR